MDSVALCLDGWYCYYIIGYALGNYILITLLLGTGFLANIHFACARTQFEFVVFPNA
jgi:hypothetical protein